MSPLPKVDRVCSELSACICQLLDFHIYIRAEWKILCHRQSCWMAVLEITTASCGSCAGNLNCLCSQFSVLLNRFQLPSGTSILSQHILDPQIRWPHISEGSKSGLLPKVWASCFSWLCFQIWNKTWIVLILRQSLEIKHSLSPADIFYIQHIFYAEMPITSTSKY